MKKLVPLVLLFAAACHKDTINSISLNMADFPVAVNDKWTYQVTDSINNRVDTAVFQITGQMAINSDSTFFTTQTIMNGTVVDSGTIMKSPNSYTYSPNGIGLFDRLKLTFPMQNNSAWGGPIVSGDTLYVYSIIQSLPVLGVNYTNVFAVKRMLIIPDYYVSELAGIAPNIGIVQENLDIQPWIPVSRTIRLISYELH